MSDLDTLNTCLPKAYGMQITERLFEISTENLRTKISCPIESTVMEDTKQKVYRMSIPKRSASPVRRRYIKATTRRM